MNIHAEIIQLKKDIEDLKKTITGNTEKDSFLTMKESAEYLRISISAMQKLSANKTIPSYKPGKGKALFKREDLIKYLHGGISSKSSQS